MGMTPCSNIPALLALFSALLIAPPFPSSSLLVKWALVLSEPPVLLPAPS